jgi:hypothetical protein
LPDSITPDREGALPSEEVKEKLMKKQSAMSFLALLIAASALAAKPGGASTQL